jgi:hypothetical protein
MLHWCCMSGQITTLGPHQQPRIATSEYFTCETGHTTCTRHKLSNIENSTTIVVIRPDNTRPVKNKLSVIGNSTKIVVICYASLVLYVWSDDDFFVLFLMNDNLCFISVVCLVGLHLFLYCSL